MLQELVRLAGVRSKLVKKLSVIHRKILCLFFLSGATELAEFNLTQFCRDNGIMTSYI